MAGGPYRLSRRVAWLGMIGAGLWLTYLQTERDALHAARTYNSAVADRVNTTFLQAGKLLDALAVLPDTSELLLSGRGSPELARRIADLRLVLRQVMFLAILDADGRLRYASDDGLPLNSDLSDQDYFITLRHATAGSPKLYIGKLIKGRVSGRFFVPLSREVTDERGTFIGVVTAALDPAYFAEMFAFLNVGQEGNVSLFQRDGTIVARAPRHADYIGRSFFRGPLIQKYLPVADQGTLRLTTVLDGRDVLLSYVAIPQTPFVINTALDATEVFAIWHRSALFASVSGVAVLFVIGLAVWREIRQLSRQQEIATQTRLRNIFDHMAVFVGIFSPEGIILESNRTRRESTGMALEDVLGRYFWDLPHRTKFPEEQERMRLALGRVRKGETVRTDFARLDAAGQRIVIDSTFKPVLDSSGKVTEIVASAIDVSERRLLEDRLQKSLAEKETLLREIHHRVKNNLQIISSLLYFQAKKIKNPDDLAAIIDGRDRLQAMILVHERLYQSKDLSRIDFGGYVRSLVDRLAESYAPRPKAVATRIEADDLALPLDLALPCGMVISELLINAFKCAFPDGRNGEVAVRIADGDGRLAVTVSDNGVGLPEGFEAKAGESFGWQLINNLSAQIDGVVAVKREGGTAVTVSFPYREAAA